MRERKEQERKLDERVKEQVRRSLGEGPMTEAEGEYAGAPVGGDLRGDATRKALPAGSAPQEGLPAHLEGGPHPPATQGSDREEPRETKGLGVAPGRAGGSKGGPGGTAVGTTGGAAPQADERTLPEGAQSHVTRTSLQGSREESRARGATGGTVRGEPLDVPEKGRSRERVGGSPSNREGVGTTVGGNSEEDEETRTGEGGVTGGAASTGDVPGGGKSG